MYKKDSMKRHIYTNMTFMGAMEEWYKHRPSAKPEHEGMGIFGQYYNRKMRR
jgi:hypothetical protein